MQILASAILIQTFYYKFTDSPEMVFIFSELDLEPWGRYLSGSIELLAGLLLLAPRTSWIGALMGASVVSVAIYVHLTSLGIEVKGDGGSTFYLAITVLISCLYIIYLRIEHIQRLFKSVQNWSRAGQVDDE